jgi:hypothetical protein
MNFDNILLIYFHMCIFLLYVIMMIVFHVIC